MTPIEFKAWFSGFTEGLEGRPNEKQWEKIKKRVEDIDGQTITEKVYIDRYHRYYPNYYPYYPYGGLWYCGSGGASSTTNMTGFAAPYPGNQQVTHTTTVPNSQFNSVTAMYSLGKSESTYY